MGEGKGKNYAIELESEIDTVLRKRDVWALKELERWATEAEVKGKMEREKERM